MSKVLVLSSCKMAAGEKAEKLHTEEKKPGAKQADASRQYKNSNLKAKKAQGELKQKPCSHERNWKIFQICCVPKRPCTRGSH
jgi:hypothetical protein